MLCKLLIVITAAAVAVTAQGNATSTASGASSSSTATPGLTPCVIACVSPAAIMDGCGSYTNVSCVCTSAQFQADAGACLQENCASDLQTALTLQSEECSAAGLSVTGPSATPQAVSFTSPGSSAATGTATSGAATSGSASGTTTPGGSSASPTSGTTTPTASPAASSTAAGHSVVANGGVAAVVAMIAGFLAL